MEIKPGQKIELVEVLRKVGYYNGLIKKGDILPVVRFYDVCVSVNARKHTLALLYFDDKEVKQCGYYFRVKEVKSC